MKDFFEFRSKFVRSTFLAPPIEHDENEISRNRKLARGEIEECDFPIIFKQTGGEKFADILNTGWVSLYLISDNLKILLENNHITGWKTYPIRLYNKKNNEITGYYGFSITGTCGPLSYENSEVIFKRYVPEGPLCKVFKGESFDLNKWDGSDIFISEGTLCIIINEKAADVLIKNKVSNFELERLGEIEMDADALDIIRFKKS